MPIRGRRTAFDKKSQRGRNKTQTRHNFCSGSFFRFYIKLLFKIRVSNYSTTSGPGGGAIGFSHCNALGGYGDHDDVIDNQCHDDSPVMALLDERVEETGQSLVGDPPPLTQYTPLYILTILPGYSPCILHCIFSEYLSHY